MKKLFCILLFLCIFTLPCMASESEIFLQQYENSGAEELLQQIPQESKEYINSVGITPNNIDSFDINTVIGNITDILSDNYRYPLNSFIKILVMIIAASAVTGFSDCIKDKQIVKIVEMVLSFSIASAIIIPIKDFLLSCDSVIESACKFSAVFTPVYAGILTACGAPVSSAAYSAFSVTVCNTVSFLLSSVIMPVCSFSLAFSFIGSCTASKRMNAVSDIIHKGAKWLLGLCAVVFIAVISIRSVVSASADSVTMRAAKFTVSSAVPVVGGALGEAIYTVSSCLGLLKNGVGAFGIIVCGYTFLPAVVSCILWKAVVSAGTFACGISGLERTSAVFKGVSDMLGVILGMLLFSLCLLIVSTCLTMTLGGSV